MPAALDYNATLVEREDLSDALAIFKVKPDEPVSGRGWFVPGQYMVLGLNNEAKPELGSVRRPMSIASSPQQTDTIDFYIRYVAHPESDNPLTHLLWAAKSGDRIYARVRPTGHFTVRHCVGESDDRLKVFVAAGTGLAPFLSQVESEVALDPGVSLAGSAILHGASYPNELGYRERLEQLARDNWLRYLPTISRPKQAPQWSGDSGRVEDFFRPQRLEALEAALGLDAGQFCPERVAVFICGLNGTIATTIERLLPRGFVPDNRRFRKALELAEDTPASVFFEQYDSTPIVDVRNEDEVRRLRGLYTATAGASRSAVASGAGQISVG